MPSISGDGRSVSLDVVITEKVDFSGSITSAPIEGNQSINDHFVTSPMQINLTGIITKRAKTKYNNLKAMHEEGVLCRYNGRTVASTCVITKFTTDYSVANEEGFSFSITLQKVTISFTQSFTYSTGLPAGSNAAQTSSGSNTGVNQPTTTPTDNQTFAGATSGANSSASKYS